MIIGFFFRSSQRHFPSPSERETPEKSQQRNEGLGSLHPPRNITPDISHHTADENPEPNPDSESKHDFWQTQPPRYNAYADRRVVRSRKRLESPLCLENIKTTRNVIRLLPRSRKRGLQLPRLQHNLDRSRLSLEIRTGKLGH